MELNTENVVISKSNKTDFSCNRTELVKKEFPKILERSLGIVTHACKKAEILTETYYRWRKSDPAFARACDEAQHSVLDYTESIFFQHMANVNVPAQSLTACIFYLKNKGRSRGWNDEKKDLPTHTMQMTDADQEIYKNFLAKEVRAAILESQKPITLQDVTPEVNESVSISEPSDNSNG